LKEIIEGMFGNLFGSSEEKDYLFSHKVYMTSEGKKLACLKLARENDTSVFIAWFKDTAEEFRKYFKENGIEETRVKFATEVSRIDSHKQQPVFLEHYPLPDKEKALAENWGIMNIPVFSAMDEPLFKHLGAEKMIPMMKLLGMKESEAIQHPMVSKSIMKGQKSIAEKVIVEQNANSQSEWMQKNLLQNDQ